MRTAFITGVNGQDGSYLSELLLSKGYTVHGTIRRSSYFVTSRIDHLASNDNFHTHYGDLADNSNLIRLLSMIRPDEIYNLGAQSHVGVSFEIPEYTGDITGLGVTRLLAAISSACPEAKLYQASTSELFGGDIGQAPQSEKTEFIPKSPYAAAKLYGYWMIRCYRESQSLFACNGILFNHESPRRGENFVSRKVAKGVVSYLKLGLPIYLGNLNAVRDWGHAKDYVEAMYLMLQRDQPEDYVIATGVGRTVKNLVEVAFSTVDIEIAWSGEGLDEVGIDVKRGVVAVAVNPKYFRPSEVDCLIGNASRARSELGWEPKIDFESLIDEMVRAELDRQGLIS